MYHSLQASKVAELMDYSDISYHTTTPLPECNNNDLTFNCSVKDTSYGKKSETKSHCKVPVPSLHFSHFCPKKSTCDEKNLGSVKLTVSVGDL